MKESQIQTSIKDKLTAAGWLVVKLIQTNTNGIPDLLCLKDGMAVFVEVKGPAGRLSEMQRYRAKQLLQYGFDVYVAKSVKDIEHLL